MGLSTKQVSGDQPLDWAHTFLPSPAAETSKPPPPQQPEPLKCPRCASTNTKFCYYNNYNKSQPRHFCKSCKRHWTKGGTLRNVPVGGGRKNKRPRLSKTSSTAAPATTTTTTDVGGKEKNISSSNILYHALMGRSSSSLMHETTSRGGAAATEIVPNTEFHFSSLGTFDMNGSLNDPASYEPLNGFEHLTGNLELVEESTITTVNIPGCGVGPWPGPEISRTMELASYWSWSDIDVLTSGDLSVSWEDEENKGVIIKP